jgi:23S rRNA (guanosine2251-2'-O)-methyltransferase
MKEWITGRNPVYEVLRAGRRQPFRLLIANGVEETARLNEILHLAELRKLRVERVPRPQLDSLTGAAPTSESHQGVAIQVSAYPYSDLYAIRSLAKQRQEALFVLVLDALQNPQNLGTLLRTAEAVGVHGVLLPLARAAGVTPAVVHASAGASEHMLIAPVNLAQALTELKKADTWVVGLDGGPASQPIEQARLDGALALVVGSEGQGMRSLVARSCDLLVRLPMRGQIESLNAAVAGSVALYLALSARNKRS